MALPSRLQYIRVNNIKMYPYYRYARIIYSAGKKAPCLILSSSLWSSLLLLLLVSYNTTPPGVAADKQHLRTMDTKSSEIMCPHVKTHCDETSYY